MDIKKLLLATNNNGKVEEMRSILFHLNLQLLTPSEIGLELQVSEDGATYAENASLKAVAFAKASGITSLADDSGLEVDVLNGLPGLHSHRFTQNPRASDADRRNYLLEMLQGKDRPWLAHFHASVALAHPNGVVQLASGECRGEIIPDERGTNGFGYDPIFLVSALGRSMAELDMQEKNRVSHRANALRNAEAILSKMLGI